MNKVANKLNSKTFPNEGDEDCGHSIGLYKSGRCRSCGHQVMEKLAKRAWHYGLLHVLMRDRYGRSSGGGW